MSKLFDNYIISEIDGLKYNRKNGQFTRHLKNNGLTYQQYYEKYITGIKEICPYCNNPKKFYQKDHTYASTCGKPKCVGKEIAKTKSNFTEEQEIQRVERFLETMDQKTDQEWQDIKNRRQQTLNKVKKNGLTGVENMVINIANTKEERYGDSKYNNSNQISLSKQERTSDQNNISNERRRQTMEREYGYKNNFLRPEVIKRSRSGKIKEYLLPSGKIVYLRGYETKALDILLNNLNEEEIIINDIMGDNKRNMIFKYIAVNRHKYNYYPDIFIPSKNLIIEVKSQWWFDGYGRKKYKSRLENNQRKKESCLDAGYNFEFWIWNNERTEFDIIK